MRELTREKIRLYSNPATRIDSLKLIETILIVFMWMSENITIANRTNE